MGDQQEKKREGETWMAQRAKYCIKKKQKTHESWFNLREEESNELWILHGSLACCSQKVAWLPEQMAHQLNYLCSTWHLPQQSHVRGPVTGAWLPQMCLLLAQLQKAQHWCFFSCEFKAAQHPFPLPPDFHVDGELPSHLIFFLLLLSASLPLFSLVSVLPAKNSWKG